MLADGVHGLVPQDVLDGLVVAEVADAWEARVRGLDADGFVLVAICYGAVAGFASVEGPPGEIAELGAIYVAPERMRRGVGRALALEVAARCMSRGFQQVVLWVLPGNSGALAFYRSLEYAPDGSRQEHASGAPTIRLVRALSGGDGMEGRLRG
jgi:ribosomal protein S18 acetylase RimI-like enzyme